MIGQSSNFGGYPNRASGFRVGSGNIYRLKERLHFMVIRNHFCETLLLWLILVIRYPQGVIKLMILSISVRIKWTNGILSCVVFT